MGFVDSYFTNNKTASATVYTRTQTKGTDGALSAITWTEGETFDVIMWDASQADTQRAGKNGADCSLVAMARPEDVTVSDIPTNCKLTIDSVDYSVIKAVNVAGQNKVIMIYLKDFSA